MDKFSHFYSTMHTDVNYGFTEGALHTHSGVCGPHFNDSCSRVYMYPKVQLYSDHIYSLLANGSIFFGITNVCYQEMLSVIRAY